MKANGHTVLITGGGSGIGLALAERFHAEGNRVILVGRDRDRLERARAGREEMLAFAGDVADPELAPGLVRAFPDVNILVNNAGMQCNDDVARTAEAELQEKVTRELEVNFTAPLRLTRAFLPGLIQRARTGEAAVINVTSGLALVPKPSAPVYCPTKAALRSFSKILRWQLEATGVRVIEVLPPLVDTDMTAGRGTGKITPDALADEFWRGFRRGRLELFIGKSKLLRMVDRLAPGVAEKIMKKM